MVNFDNDDPTAPRSMMPAPLLIPRLKTPLVDPRVTVPLLELVMEVLTCRGLLRDVPFRSIAPITVIAEGK